MQQFVPNLSGGPIKGLNNYKWWHKAQDLKKFQTPSSDWGANGAYLAKFMLHKGNPMQMEKEKEKEKDRDFKKMRKWNPNGERLFGPIASCLSRQMGWSTRSRSKFWKTKWIEKMDEKSCKVG